MSLLLISGLNLAAKDKEKTKSHRGDAVCGDGNPRDVIVRF
jgi:hypothetical protein